MGFQDFFTARKKQSLEATTMAEAAKQSDPLQASPLLEEVASRQNAWELNQIFGLLPNVDPVLSRLEDSGQGVLEALTADAHVMSVIQTRKLGSLQREFRFVEGQPLAANEAEAQAEAKPKVEVQIATKRVFDQWQEDLQNINLYEVINQILNTPFYGMVPLELIWEAKQGAIRLKEIKALPARWFGFDEKNEPRFVSKDDPYQGEALPKGKFVLARHFPNYDNPHGLSLLSRCLWPVTFKKGGMKFWVQLAEKYGMPFLVGKYPQGTTPEDQGKLLNSLAGALRDFVMVAPEGGQVEMIHPQAQNGAKVHESLKDAMNDEISKVILGQNLTTEVKGGSYAASKTHADVLASYQEADQKMVKEVIRQILRIYTSINSSLAVPPRFEWFEEDAINLDRANRDKELKAQGVEFNKEYYIHNYGLKESDFRLSNPKLTENQKEQA